MTFRPVTIYGIHCSTRSIAMDRDSLAYSTAGDSPAHAHKYLLSTAGDSPEHSHKAVVSAAGHSPEQAHKYLLWRLCRAHCPDCLETLRVVTGAKKGGDSTGHAHSRCVWRLSRALCRHWLETVRPASAAKSQVIHLHMSYWLCLAGLSDAFSALELA